MAAHLTVQDEFEQNLTFLGWRIVDQPASHHPALPSDERQQGAGSREGGGRHSGGTPSIPDGFASPGETLDAPEVWNEHLYVSKVAEASADEELWSETPSLSRASRRHRKKPLNLPARKRSRNPVNFFGGGSVVQPRMRRGLLSMI